MRKSNGSSRTPTYGAYRFIDKDPAIDQLRTIAQGHFGGRITRKSLTIIEHSGGPSTNSMYNWFFGDVKRPQSASLEAAGRGMGFRRKWVKDAQLVSKADKLLQRHSKKKNGE